jgi:excisionase family DNA binding protein
MQAMEDRLAVTLREAATKLAIGFSTLKVLVARGEIRVAKVGRRVIVPLDELRRFLSERAE